MQYPSTTAVVVMYRNGAVVEFDGRRENSILAACAWQYVEGPILDWWPLANNESVWIVPGTLTHTDAEEVCNG